MNVHVRLLDVTPGGAACLIAKGQVRGAEEVVVDLQDVAYRLRAEDGAVVDVVNRGYRH
ncbi:hypothetical protein [Nonomuraea gerenzanensis]|uniref:Uncharacterized protein n=1 Tax=Nonomuraea gerenzanensis TaxID=93944 RepID=A0A1M4EDU1_9ACTN|nr:hypothetical protein [Nonomuraea gerenzanensis]UBU08620.1 hypothetical protein LCN96_29995 [Nonomuraea gerenzanensis]SBO96980.1 hypothetical protein BN4615_P6496 [Nonomuraea gerenzanensis]